MKHESKIICKVGKWNCTASFKIVGLTNKTIEEFNKLLAKEEGNANDECGTEKEV